MTHRFTLARRATRFRASMLATLLALALGACNADELTNSISDDMSNPTELGNAGEPVIATETPSFATSFRGGIPIGLFAQPTSAFGTRFNGAMRNIWPQFLRAELAAIKARGGKVALMFAGHESLYKDGAGHFSFSKWQARVKRFNNTNFDSYIKDGTIIGHYLVDEPQDAANWNGRPIPGATLEKMAQYSKQLWPSMATIVRAEPSKIRWSGTYRHLDAAWAQYVYRRGNVNDFLRRNVSDAQKMGLGLVVGLNVSKGSPTKSRMSPAQVKSAGSAMLNSSYPCAFISWSYNASHLGSSGMKAAMDDLRRKAQGRATKSCRG